MRPIKCELSDYYKDGVSIVRFLDILEAFYYDREISHLEEIKKWEVPYFKKNMWTLGFFEGVPSSDSYGISPRGLSLLACRILKIQRIVPPEIEESMARFVLLKAIADIDWDCFSRLLIEYYVNRRRPREIRQLYFPYDKGENFSHRWGFHRKILEQITLPSLIQKISFSLDPETIARFNPYSENFETSIFFNRQFSTFFTERLKSVLIESLKLYSRVFKKDFPFTYSEVLKTIIQSFLLSENLFLNEPALCRALIDQMVSLEVPLHRSSKGVPIMGRGFYSWKEGVGVFYAFFEMPDLIS